MFSYDDLKGDPHESPHAVLSPYLFDAGGLADPHLVVREESRPINGMPQLITGSKPIDGGHLIFSVDEAETFISEEPGAAPFVRPFIGAREYLQGGQRLILALHDASPSVLAKLPLVRERVAAVREYRQASKSKPTQQIADTPALYHVNVVPTAPFLVIPQVSSERRQYVPIGWIQPPAIPSDKLRLLEEASLADFALLTSAMHMAWMRAITGRLESRYMYSVGVVYNTFPVPPKDMDLSPLDPLAQAVLDARAAHPDATLADLYDRDLMPVNLRRAHQALDRAVDRLYRPRKILLRAGARRAPLRALRADARPAGRERQEEDPAPAGSACPPFLNMDRETRIAPASGADPPDAGNTAVERRPPDPPGLGAIRRFFRQPWIQGIWAWLCMIGRGIRAAGSGLTRTPALSPGASRRRATRPLASPAAQ